MSLEEVVDLSTTPPRTALDAPSDDPLSSISGLASFFDSHTEDVSALLNDLLAPYADLSSLDKALGSLSTRLSLLSSDTSSAVEESIHDISRAVPRLTYDLQFMRESATTLQSSLSIVQSQVARQRPQKAEVDETHLSLDRLTHLDKLKTRMEAARGILQEAESWSSLEGEITEYIGKEEWEEAGTRLAEASKSMVVFQSSPGDYESRKTLLVSLQNELETRLVKALEASITAEDIASCGKLRKVFEMIERGAEFRKCYFAAKRKPVMEAWAKEETSATQLPQWFSTLSSLLHTERIQIPLIFPAPYDTILAAFLQSILDDLSPTFQSRLNTIEDQYGAKALLELIEAYKATEEFASTVHGIFSNITSKPLSLSPQASTTALPGSSRHNSLSLHRELSRSRTGSTSAASAVVIEDVSPTEWEASLFDPLLDFQSAYGSLEKGYLSPLQPKSRANTARALTDRASTVFNNASEAIVRCMSFTHGYGAIGLLEAVGEYVETFLDSIEIVASDSSAAADELDFEGLDYSTKDWEGFQHGLHVLVVCRDIQGRLQKLEGRVYNALQSRQEETGAQALMQQSPLNSAQLLDLTSSFPLDPPIIPLRPARQALRSLTKRNQSFIQSIILAPLKAQLETYPTLSDWNAPDKAPRRGELQVPSFSLGPTETIARVSEGLLNLLRVFEVYAADDALGFSIETLPFVDAESTGELSAEIVLSTWVSSLSLSLLAHLTATILPRIRNLSTSGSAQLSSDLAYLSNAVKALDVEWEDLEKWREKIDTTGTADN